MDKIILGIENFIDLSDLIYKTKDKKILYIEDNVNIRKCTKFLLEEFFDLIECRNNLTDILQENIHEFDLIITDINIHKNNYIKIIKEIKNSYSKTKIIILSTHNINLEKLIVNGIIQKPLELEKLILLLDRIF